MIYTVMSEQVLFVNACHVGCMATHLVNSLTSI